jgi:zinc D-Ala-D-Ala carboxypeptidase
MTNADTVGIGMTKKDGVFMRETKNFKRDEFRCKCGCGLLCISQVTVNMLQEARGWKHRLFPEDASIRITSGCRCRKHNKAIGGVAKSSHVPKNEKDPTSLTYAVDIAYASQAEMIALAISLSKAGFTRFGVSIKNKYIHVDNDATKPSDIWMY